MSFVRSRPLILSLGFPKSGESISPRVADYGCAALLPSHNLGACFWYRPCGAHEGGKEPMKRRRRPSPSMIVALLALFFALAGTGYAASHYIITNKSQIKPSVVTQLKGNRGLQGIPGVAGPVGPQGPAGAQGAQGPAGTNGNNGVAGPTGPAGTNGTGSIVVAQKEATVGPVAEGATVEAQVECPAGSSPTGGGGEVQGGKFFLVSDAQVNFAKGWGIKAQGIPGISSPTGTLFVTVFCKTE
jgi:hypothetical protein